MNREFTIISNEQIAYEVYRMILFGDTSDIEKPGQFMNIKIDDNYQNFLRRPISISSYNDNEITIIYKIFGLGTKNLASKLPGETLDILCPLGNGFTIKKTAKKSLLIGGGVGVPPLFELAKQMNKMHLAFDVVIGFSSSRDVFLEKDFKTIADSTIVCTIDGSYGEKGTVVDIIKKRNIHFDYYYACGPEKMLHALVREGYQGQLSFEERMGCGFGACMGCSHKTLQSYKRICKEGPVLESNEVYIDE